ncbi:MAG: aminotransferase class I/II-fold pyridoxal phosphate-dependent enzyme [Oscillospiraceae bacterium]
MIDYSRVINPTVAEIKPSGIRKFFDIASTMDDVISLGVGEPDFQTPWQIRKAGINSLEKGHTKYTANRGIAQLRSAVADFVSRKYSLTYKPESEILITVGGSEAIDACIRAAVAPGDEVNPQPSFVCRTDNTACGRNACDNRNKGRERFRYPEELAAVSERTKLLILPYPCNPTGAIMEKSDLEKIAEILKGTNILVLSTKIYSELTFGGEKHAPRRSTECGREPSP